jgi:hypothetical protein
MRELRHGHIDVLKADIEGGEWDAFDQILCAWPLGEVPVDQVRFVRRMWHIRLWSLHHDQ